MNDVSRPGLKRALADAYRAALAAEEQHGSLPPALHQQVGILLEEVGEVAEAVNRNLWTSPCHADIRAELAQVAATALRMMIKLDHYAIAPAA